ncbi:hypothetical protein Vafri_568, partial [Volvox africanus]
VCDECFPVGSDGCSTLRQKDYDPSSQKGKGSACKDGNPRVLTPQDIDNAKYIKLACILATGRFVRQVLELGTQYPHILLHLYIVHRRNFKASATSTFVPYEPYASPGQVLKAVNGRPANDYNNKKRTWRPNKDAVWKACAAKSVKAWEENIKPGLVAAYDPFMAHGDYSTQLETSLRAAGVPEAMLIDLVVGVSDTFHTSTKILQAAGVPLDAVVKQAYGAGAPEVRNDFSMEGDPQQQCKPKQPKQQPPTEPQDVGTRQVLQPPKVPQQGLQL